MAIAPFAQKRLIPKWNQIPITRHRRVNIHVAVTNADSIYGMFSRSNSACSHFYVNLDGEIEQYIDTRYRSASDMRGNDSTISIENAGAANPKTLNSEKLTAAQVVANAMLWAWLRDTHGITNKLAKNTQSNYNSAGLSWHRLGVQGNFNGRGGILESSYKSGGILYSSARGKECPGDAKILQIPGIFAMANGKTYKQVRGDGAAKPTAPAKPKPVKRDVPDQSPSNLPNGSTTFPDNYVDLPINGLFQLWEVGALQILLNNVVSGRNKQWDGDFGKLTVYDTMTLLQRNGYYLQTPFAAKGLAKGTELDKDGVAGYWFWVEFQRMLGNDEKNRGNGKVYYDLNKYKLDGDPGKATYDAVSRWLNDNN